MSDDENTPKIKPDRESILAWAVRWAKKNDPQAELFEDKRKEDEDADAA